MVLQMGEMDRKHTISNILGIREHDSAEASHCIHPQSVSTEKARISGGIITVSGCEVLNWKGMGRAGIDGSMTSSNIIRADDCCCMSDVRSDGECRKWVVNLFSTSFDKMGGPR